MELLAALISKGYFLGTLRVTKVPHPQQQAKGLTQHTAWCRADGFPVTTSVSLCGENRTRNTWCRLPPPKQQQPGTLARAASKLCFEALGQAQRKKDSPHGASFLPP